MAQVTAKKEAYNIRRNLVKEAASSIREAVPESLQRAMDLLQENSTSSWFTSVPLEEF